MRDMLILKKGGNRFKGNLHSHTINSDGKLTPSQSAKLYRDHGYSFLCLSEHDKYTDYRSELNSEDFIILPGLEASATLVDSQGKIGAYKTHHIHGILGTAVMQKQAKFPIWNHLESVVPPIFYGTWDGAKVAQELCDNMRDHGCITTYNHPVWSRVRESEFIDTEGITALEIFNYNTVNECAAGFDSARWDVMLREGKKVWAVATDDNHNWGPFDDACGGYIVVQADSLNHDNIIEGIIAGNYYSSSGPEIYEWGIVDGKAYVSCSEVNRINFIVGNLVGDGVTLMENNIEEVLTCGEYLLKGHETYIRVECGDKYGRTAWSNPIYLDECDYK